MKLSFLVTERLKRLSASRSELADSGGMPAVAGSISTNESDYRRRRLRTCESSAVLPAS
jgi:hypothetical protein